MIRNYFLNKDIDGLPHWSKTPIHIPNLDILQPHHILIISLGIAFYIVNVWQPVQRKPFNCMMCMTGWVSGVMGGLFFGWYGPLFIPVGLLSGALFEAISNRYL